MHETLNREEEIKVPPDQSFGIVFTLVFLAMGIWVVSEGQSVVSMVKKKNISA